MKPRLHHQEGEVCPLCEFKLTMADPMLVEWFHAAKKTWQNMHVSWSFRDKASQDKAYEDGASTLKWPNSAHNATRDGKPRALALDIFQLDEDGVARFSKKFCEILWAWTQTHYAGKFIWGGSWRKLGDFGHYELLKSQLS